MKNAVRFFLLLLTMARPVAAQPLPLNIALRYIKAGNTLREAQQYTQAKSLLEKALKTTQSANDRYWTAAAYENLGLLARDRNDLSSAGFYFNKALEGYQAVGATMSAKVIRQIMSGVKGDKDDKPDQDLYGGIDIGSKGVKMSVVSLRFGRDGKPAFKLVRADQHNTAAMEATPTAFAETAKAVSSYLDSLLNGRKIPRNRVFVVGSSGLKAAMEQPDKAGKMAELEKVLKAELGTVWPDPIPFIDAATEAELTVRGTLPESEWTTTATMDIGSGNAKGGYFSSGDNRFEFVDFLGTGVITNLMKASGKSVAESAQAVYDDELRNRVAAEMARKPDFQNRKRIYLLGGIVYALVTYLHPREINNALVPFSYKDAVRLQDLAIKNYATLTNPDLSGIDSDETFKKAQAAARGVRENLFTRDQLIAGATLLRGILDECRKANPNDKEFVFHRNGVIGWISGYIIRETEKDYQQTKEQ